MQLIGRSTGGGAITEQCFVSRNVLAGAGMLPSRELQVLCCVVSGQREIQGVVGKLACC